MDDPLGILDDSLSFSVPYLLCRDARVVFWGPLIRPLPDLRPLLVAEVPGPKQTPARTREMLAFLCPPRDYLSWRRQFSVPETGLNLPLHSHQIDTFLLDIWQG